MHQEKSGISSEFVKSMTYDRGPENAGYKEISNTLDITPCACTQYHSWEKGTVENMIGRIRRYIPKGTSVDNIPQAYLTLLENKLNNAPRKCLGFLTPGEYCKKIHLAS